MKKLILALIVYIFFAIFTISQSNAGFESKCITYANEMEKYGTYKKKIEQLIMNIEKKDEEVRIDIYKKINSEIVLILSQGTYDHQVYTILSYILCKSTQNLESISSNTRTDLGNNFSIVQDFENTKLMYGDTIIKIHKNDIDLYRNNIESMPLIDLPGACPDLYVNADGGFEMNEWEQINREDQKNCLLKVMRGNFKIEETSHSRFYEIYTISYEAFGLELFDIENLKTVGGHYGSQIKKIESGNTGTYIQYEGGWGSKGGVRLVYSNGNVQQLSEGTCNQARTDLEKNNCKEIEDFELLVNKQIKVIYKDGFGNSKEEIIDLNNL